MMPKNARKAPRSQVPRRAPLPAASQPAQPERQDMAGNDRVSDSSSLAPRQQAVLPVVALSSSSSYPASRSSIGGFAQKRSETIGLFEFSERIRRPAASSYPPPRSAIGGFARKRSEIIGLFEFSERIRRPAASSYPPPRSTIGGFARKRSEMIGLFNFSQRIR